jgi:hypothetical protein
MIWEIKPLKSGCWANFKGSHAPLLPSCCWFAKAEQPNLIRANESKLKTKKIKEKLCNQTCSFGIWNL